ncbi:MAG: DNA alkylation repair protein [Bacteroidota bacterium]
MKKVNQQLSPRTYLRKAQSRFEASGQPEVAEQQMRYLRNQFGFYGLKAPVWTPLAKELFATYGLLNGDKLKRFVRFCFKDDHRELHYLAIEMVQKQLRKQDADFIDFLEEMVLLKSWWDTVDWISKLVYLHLWHHPHQTRPRTEAWMNSNNIWLQRVAIIFQRYAKSGTDETLLFNYILRVADSKEFFLQKGAGWALRDYSKVNPEAVIHFINNNALPALTKREGLKWMKKQGIV